jgi:two-component system OmpR family sensor kinase
MSSLRNKLLAWLLGAVAVIGAGGAWFSYRHALAEANAYFDYHLQQTGLLLRDQIYGFAPRPGLPQEVPQYDFVVQVWTLEGVRVWQSRPHTVLPGLTQLGLSTVETGNGRWRVFGVEAGPRVIQVAQPMDLREGRAAQLAWRTLQPFALLLPALALLIVWIVARLTRPVRAFSSALRARDPGTLEPLVGMGLPAEIQPVADSLNDLLARLREALARERAFIADAAHELRTPLTALHLQADEVAALPEGGERDAAMRRLAAGIDRMARLVEQLLALARTERETHLTQPVDVSLQDVARDVVAELLPLADAKGVDLGIDQAEPAVVRGERDSLHVLVRNLVDNAVRYTPAGGRVDLVMIKAGELGGPELCVTDTGPGLPPSERERAFDRFYRVPGSDSSGSGIGLALVRSIAERHGARTRLEDGPGGQGLRARVSFPQHAALAEPDASAPAAADASS